jgi:hypothetical protein
MALQASGGSPLNYERHLAEHERPILTRPRNGGHST